MSDSSTFVQVGHTVIVDLSAAVDRCRKAGIPPARVLGDLRRHLIDDSGGLPMILTSLIIGVSQEALDMYIAMHGAAEVPK